MNPEITLLSLTAASIAFAHTLLGPDHYLPFVAMARSRGWTLAKTMRITLACGAGHLAGSVLLGGAGILLGIQLSSLQWLEGIRGGLAAWLLIGFGLAYLAWGLRRAWRNRPHTHWHAHDEALHRHRHTHHADHAHLHEEGTTGRSLGPWLIFLIFVLGPCEPLIPLLMYPAARESFTGVVTVTAVFGLVTIVTMLLTVYLAVLGLGKIRLQPLERYSHALAGGAILACGLGVVLLGL